MAEADDETEEFRDAGPLRTCIVTRRQDAPENLLRFVLGPDGTVVFDLKRKLPGRGVWVSPASDLLAEAVRKKGFGRAFKGAAKVPETLVSDVDRLLERDALQALSLANKAGLVTTGAAKVEAAVARGTVRALIHASDGGADGMRKLRQAIARRHGDPHAVPVIEIFASNQLDLALGRANVIHAALGAGPASEGFVARCARLASFRRAGDAHSAEENACPPPGSAEDGTAGIEDEQAI